MSCKDCKLPEAGGCKNILISGRGSKPKKTKYLVIQDTPTNYDDICDEALTGDTRAKFNYFLERSGIDPKEVFFTSAVKCFVKDLQKVKKDVREHCEDYLITEITDHRPEVIITMGKIGNQMLTDNDSVREFRGHFEEFEAEYNVSDKVTRKFKCPIMPTWGLRQSLMKWEYNDDIIRDFIKARKYVETKVVPVTAPPKINTILTVRGLKDFVEKYREVKYAATDFETTGFDFWRHKIINSGYYSGDGVADIVFLERYKKEHTTKWTREEIQRGKEINAFLKKNRSKCLGALKLVHGFDTKWILHNGKFDSKFATKNGIPYKDFWFDTMRADPLIEENVGHALNICMERRGINYGAYDTTLWKYINKGEKSKKSYQHIPPQLIEHYLGIDVAGCWKLFRKIHKELKTEGMTEHFHNVCMETTRNVTDMEYEGVPYDREALLEAGQVIEDKQAKVQNELAKMTGNPNFNPNSAKEVVSYMLDNDYPLRKLGVKRNATGYSIAKEELDKLMKYKKYNKFPKLVLQSGKLSKLRGTYIDGAFDKKEGVFVDGGFLKYLDPNNRIHASFNLHSPKTSRMSVNSPSLQVFPRPVKGLPNARTFIIPSSPDKMLFECDYKQLELLYVSSLSKDKNLIRKINSGVDLHCDNAITIGGALNTIPSWVTYDHMLLANDKKELIKDADTINELMKDIEKHSDINYKETRTRAKNLAFGLNYGQSYLTFAKDFNIPVDASEDMVDAYFEEYFGLKSWRDDVVRQALENGFITLPSGRKRRFHPATDWLNNGFSEGIWSADFIRGEVSRQAMNYPVQGGAHEIFEAAINRLMARFKKEGLSARLLLLIHDGLVGECNKEEIQVVNQCMLEEMPVTMNKGTVDEVFIGIDTDFYKWAWYGEKIKI